MQGPRFPSHFTASKANLADENDRTTTPDEISVATPELKKTAAGLKETAKNTRDRNREAYLLAEANLTWFQIVKRNLRRHVAFVGPGMIAAIAYLDPGNFSTDLAAGAGYGYSQLCIVLMAAGMALLYQLLATRLGVVSGMDLASHCRLALHDRPRHKMLIRWGVLYPLYVVSELAIIFTDIAESLGAAIAINLLIPKIPLAACVVITGADVLLILFLFDQYPSKVVTPSMRVFEAGLGVLVLIVMGCFVALLVKIEPVWRDAFLGYVPSAAVFSGGALYAATGIIGATVMPHAFFIGSKLATVRRIRPAEYGEPDEAFPSEAAQLAGADPASAQSSTFSLPDPLPSLACVKVHLVHAQWDVAGSLIGFALVVNSAILMVAAAVFFYGDGAEADREVVADLFGAFDLIQTYVGDAFGYLFAVALLASATAASLTVTLSGQIVSEGFIRWKLTPWKRRAITRAIGIVPSLAVAIAVGRSGIDAILIGSQVALSMILPFVLAPLIIFTAKQEIMSVAINRDYDYPSSSDEVEKEKASAANSPTDVEASACPVLTTSSSFHATLPSRALSLIKTLNPIRRRRGAIKDTVSFASPAWCITLAWIFWLMICMANVAALNQLASGA